MDLKYQTEIDSLLDEEFVKQIKQQYEEEVQKMLSEELYQFKMPWDCSIEV